MPDPDVNTPPDTAAWVAGGDASPAAVADAPADAAAADAGAAPAADAGAAPEVPQTRAEATELVEALVKSGWRRDLATQKVEALTAPPPIKDALEAYLDGKPYQVPKGLVFKLKNGNTFVEKPLTALQTEGMLYHDYQLKTTQVAQMRRAVEQAQRDADARIARAEARETWLKEREQEMLEAQKDPAKWEQYQELMRVRQANPAFAKLWDDALKAREQGAELEMVRQAQTESQVSEGVQTAVTWITDAAKDFPTVDPERVRVLYGMALEKGQADLSPAAVRQIFETEQAYLTKASQPVTEQMAALQARLAELEGKKADEAHNAHTARVLDRAKAPNTAPAGGSPAAPRKVEERKPIPPERGAMDKAISDWTKVRD